MTKVNFDKAVERYLELREEVDAITREANKEKAVLREKMVKLEKWVTLKAQKEGIDKVPTEHGTAYWSIRQQATIADQEAFMNYVIAGQRWDLIEKRVSKTAVKAQVDENGEVPPGVNYGQTKVFNVRRAAGTIKEDAA